MPRARAEMGFGPPSPQKPPDIDARQVHAARAAGAPIQPGASGGFIGAPPPPAGPVLLMRGGGANAAAPGAPAQGQSWYQGQQGAVGGYSRSVIWPFNDPRRGGRAGSTCVWPPQPVAGAAGGPGAPGMTPKSMLGQAGAKAVGDELVSWGAGGPGQPGMPQSPQSSWGLVLSVMVPCRGIKTQRAVRGAGRAY